MIFKGMPELSDINDYRNKAMNRKMRYCEENGIAFKGVGQLEFEIIEALERIYERHGDLPYVMVKEEGDASILRQQAKLNTRIRSDIINDCYCIICPWGLPIALGRFTGSVFHNPLGSETLKMMREKGIKFPEYKKSIFEFPAFQRFSVCKADLSNFIRTMTIWFASLHEFGHIANGHNDLKGAINCGDANITPEQRKALEIHADMTAVQMLLEIISSWQKYVGVVRKEVHLNGTNPGITYCDEISFAALAAYISLRCFLPEEEKKWDEWTIGLHYMDRATHPLVHLRMAIVFNCCLQGLAEIAENETERIIFSQSFVNMVIQFEEFLFQNEGAEERDRFFFSPTELIRTEEGKEYFKGVFDALLELNEILENYTGTLFRIEGEWIEYETFPKEIFDK